MPKGVCGRSISVGRRDSLTPLECGNKHSAEWGKGIRIDDTYEKPFANAVSMCVCVPRTQEGRKKVSNSRKKEHSRGRRKEESIDQTGECVEP